MILDPFLCIASSLPIAWKAEKYFGHQPQFRLQSIGITSSLTSPSLFIGQVLFQEYLFNEMWNRPAQAPVAWMTPQHLVAPIESLDDAFNICTWWQGTVACLWRVGRYENEEVVVSILTRRGLWLCLCDSLANSFKRKAEQCQ